MKNNKAIAVPKAPIETINLRFTKETDKPKCFDALEPGDKVKVTISAIIHSTYEKRGKEYDNDTAYACRVELSNYKIDLEPAKKGAKSIKEAMEEIQEKRKM